MTDRLLASVEVSTMPSRSLIFSVRSHSWRDHIEHNDSHPQAPTDRLDREPAADDGVWSLRSVGETSPRTERRT